LSSRHSYLSVYSGPTMARDRENDVIQAAPIRKLHEIFIIVVAMFVEAVDAQQ
jgi:hypothetical protein